MNSLILHSIVLFSGNLWHYEGTAQVFHLHTSYYVHNTIAYNIHYSLYNTLHHKFSANNTLKTWEREKAQNDLLY